MNLNDYYCHDCRDWTACKHTGEKGRECLVCGAKILCDDCGQQWRDDHTCRVPTPEPLDTEQVKDLVYNGFTRFEAARAVAESHGQDESYVTRLLDDLAGQTLEGEQGSYGAFDMPLDTLDEGVEIDAGIYSAAVAAVRRRRR